MDLKKQVLLDLKNEIDGREIDEKYSGDQYIEYKRAVKELLDEGYIEDAAINTFKNEIQTVSLKNAQITEAGMEKLR